MKILFLLTLLTFAWTGTTAGAVVTPALQSLQESINQAVARVRPSVVSVKAQKKKEVAGVWYESIGAGFFVDSRGFLLTNYHVVEGAENITVTLWRANNNTFQARVIHADKTIDLAVLKIDGNESFVVSELGNTDRLETGDWVLSIGSPFGFTHTVTLGIVSDLHREMVIEGVTYKDMIQTDAVINQGNSGGPLVDIAGNVVGVGTAIYAPNGSYAGLGFAIPINRARHFFTRVTGAMRVALTTPAAPRKPKTPINLNAPMPNDAVHKEFSDCTTCHTIGKKSVVNLKVAVPHPQVGPCGTCHILVNEKVVHQGPVPVAAVTPMADRAIHDQPFAFIFKTIVLKLALLTLGASIIFSMLGVGGGFLYVPILLSCGIDFHTATTTSLVMLTAAQISALYNFFKSRLVDLKLAMVLEIPTMIGAFAGGFLAHYFNVGFLYIMFSCVLFLASYFMLQDSTLMGTRSRGISLSQWEWSNRFGGHDYSVDLMLSTPLTFVIGYMGGMLGLAGGWLKVPIMVVLFNVPMKIAVATSSLMVMFTGFSGFLGHSLVGHFDPRLALSLSLITVIGAQIGSRISLKTESNLLRFIFAFILSVVGLWMIIKVF